MPSGVPFKGISWGRKLILDSMRHLVVNLCIKLNYFFLLPLVKNQKFSKFGGNKFLKPKKYTKRPNLLVDVIRYGKNFYLYYIILKYVISAYKLVLGVFYEYRNVRNCKWNNTLEIYTFNFFELLFFVENFYLLLKANQAKNSIGPHFCTIDSPP